MATCQRVIFHVLVKEHRQCSSCVALIVFHCNFITINEESMLLQYCVQVYSKIG